LVEAENNAQLAIYALSFKDDDDLDEPLPERTASCDGDTCESCQ
jgi:hypothetical protein